MLLERSRHDKASHCHRCGPLFLGPFPASLASCRAQTRQKVICERLIWRSLRRSRLPPRPGLVTALPFSTHRVFRGAFPTRIPACLGSPPPLAAARGQMPCNRIAVTQWSKVRAGRATWLLAVTDRRRIAFNTVLVVALPALSTGRFAPQPPWAAGWSVLRTSDIPPAKMRRATIAASGLGAPTATGRRGSVTNGYGSVGVFGSGDCLSALASAAAMSTTTGASSTDTAMKRVARPTAYAAGAFVQSVSPRQFK